MRRSAYLLPVALALVMTCARSTPAAENDPPTAFPWEIEVDAPSREVVMTDLRTTHWATETGAREQRAYAGLYTSMHESLDDYVLRVDGRVLEPAEARRVVVTPWSLVREYEGGIRETVFLALHEAALFVRVDTGARGGRRVTVTPRVDLRWIWKPEPGRYRTRVHRFEGDDEPLLALVAERTGWTPGPGAPDRLVTAVAGATVEDRAAVRSRPVEHPRDAARRAMGRSFPAELPTIERDLPEGVSHVDVLFLPLTAGADESGLGARVRDLLGRRDELLRARRAYFEAMEADRLRSGDARLDKAWTWARASLDQMIMDTRGAGIYAGFHWFTNYWGRDTFICLPGATLVTGRLDAAREILRGFLAFQEVDRGDPREGRLPNIVQPGQLQYAGVDGTWWYARAAHRYVRARRAAGERDLAYEREFLAALGAMIDGAERHAVDAHGLLRHGDGETWMDAGGEADPQSPRGDRAVEVQALYYNGLCAAAWLAGELGEAEAAARYRTLAARTREAFATLFWIEDEGRLADHLDPDGSQDRQVRPNTILALTAVEPEWPALLDEERYRAEVELVHDRLVLPWGVTSLDPADPAYHPRHLDLDAYHYDEAYHNGDVWLWLSGPMITALCRVGRTDDALAMLDVLVDETLDHGAVGAIREIRDGVDTGQREEFGGATFQAWSMAEFLRAVDEDLAPRMGWTR